VSILLVEHVSIGKKMKAADDVVEAIPVASGTLVGNGYPTTSTGMATATAQPIVVPGAQFVQPQIVYQQQPQLLVTGPRQTYCGPITLLFALCLVFLIGPFAILLVRSLFPFPPKYSNTFVGFLSM